MLSFSSSNFVEFFSTEINILLIFFFRFIGRLIDVDVGSSAAEFVAATSDLVIGNKCQHSVDFLSF